MAGLYNSKDKKPASSSSGGGLYRKAKKQEGEMRAGSARARQSAENNQHVREVNSESAMRRLNSKQTDEVQADKARSKPTTRQVTKDIGSTIKEQMKIQPGESLFDMGRFKRIMGLQSKIENEVGDYAKRKTGLNHVEGALQGAVSSQLGTPEEGVRRTSSAAEMSKLPNIRKTFNSVVEGFKNPDVAAQEYQRRMAFEKEDKSKAAGVYMDIGGSVATDPTNVLPIGAAVKVGAKVGERIAGGLYRLSKAESVANHATDVPLKTSEQAHLAHSEVAASVPGGAPEEVKPIQHHWFQRLFGEQGVGITPFASTKSTRMVNTEQQIVKNPLKQNVTGALESTKQVGKAAYQNTVDYLSPLKRINRETYNTAMDASRANNIANTIIHDKFVDNQGNVIGHSLNDIMKNVRGMGKKFDDYLVMRHAVTRMGRGERVYDEALQMTPEKASRSVATMEARYPGLKEVGDQWDNFNGNMLDSAVREGLLSQAARDAMRAENPHYASMRRQFTIGEKLAQPKFGGGGSSFSGQSAPIKAVSPTGSTRKIVSPIRSAIEQAYAWKNAELRNRTMQEITKAIQMDPEGMKGIAEIVKKPSTSYKSLDEALRKGGSEEFLKHLDNDFKSLFQQSKSGEENIVRAMVNGNPVYVKVHNPEAVKALLGIGQEQSGIIMKAFQKLSNATKRGATGLFAPMFAVKNLTADTVQAAIQSPNAFKHVVVDLPHAIISSIGDVLSIPGLKNLAEDFRRAGGEYSALIRGDRQLNKSVFNLRKEAPLSGRGLMKGMTLAVKAPFKALEKVADVTENVNRMAAYRRSLVGNERTPQNIRNAINSARESTVNFSRKGALAQQVESFVPYSNAAMQGIYRLAKSFNNPKTALKTVAGIGTLIVAPKLYEYAKFNNDPDYQKIPARERYRNIIISKNADGTFNKQPMPPEYLALGSFVQDVLNDVVNKDPQAYKGTLDAVVNAFTPPLVSGFAQGATQGGEGDKSWLEKSIWGGANATVLAPLAAVGANQSFTGAPIVPQRLSGNSPEFQADERTSGIAKSVGEKLGISPLKVDYLLKSYGGDPARLILPLSSDSGGGTPRNTLLKNFIVDPVFTNTLSNDFYTAKDAFTKAKNDYADFGKELPKWYSEEAYKLINSQAEGSASKRLSALNGDKRSVQGDKSLSAQVKADKIRDIQSQINDIYADVNSQLQHRGFKFPNR